MHDCVTRMLDDTTTVAVRAVLFDLTAAFDNIRHDILLNRMINCDLDSSFIKWCSSYLENRTIRVKVNSSYGPRVTFPPLFHKDLFLAHSSLRSLWVVSNFQMPLMSWTMYLFSSQMTFCFCNASIIDKIDYHRSATNCVRDWCSKNDVILNEKKTKQLFF